MHRYTAARYDGLPGLRFPKGAWSRPIVFSRRRGRTGTVVGVAGAGDRARLGDVRAAKFHPLTTEDTLVQEGRLALGLPADAF